jgi:hypothetical protein
MKINSRIPRIASGTMKIIFFLIFSPLTLS